MGNVTIVEKYEGSKTRFSEYGTDNRDKSDSAVSPDGISVRLPIFPSGAKNASGVRDVPEHVVFFCCMEIYSYFCNSKWQYAL